MTPHTGINPRASKGKIEMKFSESQLEVTIIELLTK